MSLKDILLWGAVGALLLGLTTKEAYDAGVASQAAAVQTANDDRDTARQNAAKLKRDLEEVNKKVLEYKAGGEVDEKVKGQLQLQAKVSADAGQVRVNAAKTVTTSTDDVLRKYWEAE